MDKSELDKAARDLEGEIEKLDEDGEDDIQARVYAIILKWGGERIEVLAHEVVAEHGRLEFFLDAQPQASFELDDVKHWYPRP